MEERAHADDRKNSEAIAKCIATFEAICCDLVVEGVEARRSNNRCWFGLLELLTSLTAKIFDPVQDFRIGLYASLSILAIADEPAWPAI